jgi:hypothetical protein
VTCGDVGIEKAVVVPKSLFPQMLKKLTEYSRSKSYKSDWLSTSGARWDLQGFLARRCSKEFLSLYLQINPGLLDQVSKPGLFLDAVTEVRLAKRLHEFGLLPEENRRKFIDTVSKYAIEGEDADALDDEGIRSLFTDDEFEEFVARVRAELLPQLWDVRRRHESDYSPGASPDEHMQPLLEVFESLKKRFGDDESAIILIDREIRSTKNWIDENTPLEPEQSPRKLEKVEEPEKPHSTRSIFDDIDAN